MRFPLSPAAFVRNLWRHRDLVAQMTERDALARYRGSAGGLFWVAFTPLLMLGVYTVFFTEVFPTQVGNARRRSRRRSRWSSSSGCCCTASSRRPCRGRRR